jgi:capsular exopolysaccharide synthesis family protein
MSRIDEALVRAKSRLAAAALDENRAAFEMAPEHYPLEGASSSSRQMVAEPLRQVHRPKVDLSSPARREATVIADDKLVTRGAPNPVTEQYSRLAATLHDAQHEQGLRTLMVTSALPREGKTLTATNLALTLSELYSRRVLLIDADLRRPSVHELLRLPNRNGLGSLLRSEFAPLPLVEVSAQLAVLVAGPPDANPMAALASTRMKSILEEAAAQFDWVIVDTPPVGLLPDANLIARWVDGVLLVIAARVTHYRSVQDALALLGPERVVGTVLNGAIQAVAADYGHYYQPPSSHPTHR